MSTAGSATRAAYEPWAVVDAGASMARRKALALAVEVDDATAARTWVMSVTPRVEGSVRRSLAKASGEREY